MTYVTAPAMPRRYDDVILETRPVLYVPIQGDKLYEVVRSVAMTITGGPTPYPGAINGRFARRITSTNYLSVATNAAYHPGDTFSIGGWFNRLGAGENVSGPVLYHTNGDVVVWFPVGTNAGRLVLRKSGVGDVFASSTTDWGSPYTKGWHHAIFTKSGATTKLYVDGRPDAGGGTVANQTFSAANTEPPTFGQQSNLSGGLFLDGVEHDWAVWDRVLTDGEVLKIYQSGLSAG